jgi:hypothetical protein
MDTEGNRPMAEGTFLMVWDINNFIAATTIFMVNISQLVTIPNILKTINRLEKVLIQFSSRETVSLTTLN